MRKRCLLTLLAAILFWLALAIPANAETRIEVDENGDEYELKRFHIQGRQLNGSGSKSQCVVTRRKRASRAMTLPGPGVTVSSQQLSLSGGPNAPEHREAIVLNQENGKRRYVALTALQLEEDDEDDDDDEEEEDDEEAEEESENVLPQIVQLQTPQKLESQQKQLQGQTNLVAATFALPAKLPQGVSVVANAATHANVGGDAGIVVVQSEQPPKVNPSTHAVFELKPLQQQQEFQYWPQNMQDFEQNAEEEDNEDEDDDLFYYGNDRYQELGFYDEHDQFITEDSPMSTTAIWSTDNDDVHPVINEPNQSIDGDKKKKKKRRKQTPESLKRKTNKKQKRKRPSEQDMELEPVKEQQQVKRKQQSSSSSATDKRKPAKKPSSSSSISSSGSSSSSSSSTSSKRKRPSSSVSNKRRPNSSQRQKKKKSKPSQSVKRRRPSSSSSLSGSSSSSRPIGGYKRRRPSTSSAQVKRRRQQLQEKRRRQEQQRRRRRRNKNRQNGGHRRQYYDSEPIINCIYINKDPPTTTQRPFWNILGRDAAAKQDPALPPAEASQVPRSSDFGLRKRTNLRFGASK